MDFSTAITELVSCKTQETFNEFLLKHNFTFKTYEAKKELDSELVTLDNQFIYVIKHPYQDKDGVEEEKEVIVNPKLEMFDKFGRGIVLRVNFNDDKCHIDIMSLPLPFGQEDFLEKQNLKDTQITTLVDGTGFNVSKDPVSRLLFVSTRACGGYYPDGPTNYFADRNYNYGTMFRESLAEHNMETSLDDLTVGTSLHFVMEHPADNKVYPVDKPRLHLVNVFTIKDNVVTYEDINEFQMKYETNFMTPILLTNIDDIESIENIRKHSNAKITPGIKIFEPKTLAWSKRILTEQYDRIKTLLKNDKNILYTLIRLRHEEGQYRRSMAKQTIPSNHKSVVKEFLEYFPEYSDLYSSLSSLCEDVMNDLFDIYLHVYTVRDNGTIAEKIQYVPREFNDLVRKIHDNYRVRRTEYQNAITNNQNADIEKPITTKNQVKTYFNGLPPALIYDRLRQYSNRLEYMSEIFPVKQQKESNEDTKSDEVVVQNQLAN